MSEETVNIGDFEIPLDEVKTVILPTNKEITFEVKKSERKTYAEKRDDGSGTKVPTGRELAYYSLQLSLPEYPGEVVFHKYFLAAKNLSNRHADRSWKVFLDVLQLPYTTVPTDNGMAGVRFVGTLREDKDRGEYIIASIKGKA